MSDVILTLNVTSRGYLTLFDVDNQEAGYDISKYPVKDVIGWLGTNPVGPKCPI